MIEILLRIETNDKFFKNVLAKSVAKSLDLTDRQDSHSKGLIDAEPGT